MFRLRHVSKYAIIAGSLCLHNISCESQCQAKAHDKTSTYSYPANNPSEDRYVIGESRGDYEIYGVFDGHGGWQVSEYASKNLVSMLGEQLHKAPDIPSALTATFSQIEESYISKVIESYKLGFGEVGKVGSCAIVAVIKNNHLTVANSGDCRVVVGSVVTKVKDTAQRKNEAADIPTSEEGSTISHQLVDANGLMYSAFQMNRDHNARTALEQFLLRSMHPNEDNIVVCKNTHACYVKGRLQLTRALGDAYLKYPEFNAPASAHRSSGRHIPDPYTPPYVLTEPEVHELALEPSDKFVVMATDGVWDFLTPADAIRVVASCPLKERHLAAEMIVNETLRRAAEIVSKDENREVTVEDLKALPPGRSRRTKFDDTTAVVIFL